MFSIHSYLRKGAVDNYDTIFCVGPHQTKEIRETEKVYGLKPKKIINYVDEKFKGNENYKKIIETSAFCSEDNNIISENYKITKDQKIGIIPPIGGG